MKEVDVVVFVFSHIDRSNSENSKYEYDRSTDKIKHCKLNVSEECQMCDSIFL